MTDYSRAIIASLFTPPPGQPRQSPFPLPPSPLPPFPSSSLDTHPSSPTTAQESLIAHVQTLEDQPGSSTKKQRFLILSGKWSPSFPSPARA